MLLLEFSEKSKNNIQSCFSWQIYRSITIKSNQFARKKHRPSDFLKKQREKKMNNKHSQVLLVFRKNPRKWSFGWSSVLKTCTALIAGIFERICCFDKVFSMALTFTEQLFIEIPLYRRFLHNIHLSYSR